MCNSLNYFKSFKKDLRKKAANFRQAGHIDSVIISGMSIEYLQVGSAKDAVVFIHGNSSCKEVFSEQMNNLVFEDFCLISIDLPGHGGSDNAIKPEENYTIPGYARLLGELLVKLNIKEYIVIGWSLGGNIAIEMVGQKLPIKGIAIIGTPAIGPCIENIENAYLPSSLEAPGKADLTNEETIDFTQAIYEPLNPIPELLFQAVKRTDGQARKIMLTHWIGGGPGYNQVKTVSQWDKPICVIQGKNEPFVALDYLVETPWKNLWHDNICLIEQSGHAPFIDNANEVNRILSSFILDITN